MARFDRAKRAFLVSKLGEARVRRLEEGTEAFTKQIEALGIAWKGAQQHAAGQQAASPVSPYVDDLRKRQPLSAKELTRIEDIPNVGPYLADLVRVRSMSSNSEWKGVNGDDSGN